MNQADQGLDKKPSRIRLTPMENPPKISSDNNIKDSNVRIIEEEDKLVQAKKEKENNIHHPSNRKKSLNIKKKIISSSRRFVKRFMSSRFINNLLIFLITLYIILIFATVAISDLLSDEELAKLYWLSYIEVIILSFFMVEIFFSSYGQGFMAYFKDPWLVFDALVIWASMALVILNLTIDFGSQFSTISSIIRGLFRFLRIFLLIRKMQTIKKIKTSSKIQTPAEKIIDFLGEIRELFEIQDIIQDIDWSIEVIGSNKLYDPVFREQDGTEDGNNWIDYGAGLSRRQDQDQQEYRENIHQKSKRQNIHRINPRNDRILAIIPEKVMNMFSNIDELSFDCWEMKKLTKGQELKYLMLFLFESNNLIYELGMNPTYFSNFVTKIQENYHDNPYHNCLHAFDVTQTANFFLKKLKLDEIAQLSCIQVASCYIAAACHDVDHPGYQNVYLMNCNHSLSIRYNDQAILENHHVSFTFNLLLCSNEYNFSVNWSNEDYKQFRELCIEIILGTDMARHFQDISKLKARLASPEFNILDKNDKFMCISSVIHSCDVSNPIKEWGPCFNWTEVVMAEFWRQGDSERDQQIPVSYLCDRYTTNIAKSQGGFINFVVKPLYELITNFLPDLQPYLQNFNDNNERWIKLIPEYDDKLKLLNDEKDKKIKQ